MSAATRHHALRISFATFSRACSRRLVGAFLAALFCASFARAAEDVADTATQFAVLPVWWKDGQAALDLLERGLKDDDSLTTGDKASLEFGYVKGAEEVLTVGGTSRAVERARRNRFSRSSTRNAPNTALRSS